MRTFIAEFFVRTFRIFCLFQEKAVSLDIDADFAYISSLFQTLKSVRALLGLFTGNLTYVECHGYLAGNRRFTCYLISNELHMSMVFAWQD